MYLTLTQHCERVGAPEIVRVTNDRVTEKVDPVLFAEWCAGKDDPSFSDPSLPTQGMLDIEVVFDAAEADARETVNSYLQAHYSDKLPFETATIPLVIVKAMSNIVRHELHDLSVPDTVRVKYEDTVKWLVLISRGTLNLGLDVAGAVTSKRGGPKSKDRGKLPTRIFRSSLEEAQYIDETL